jgi:menaquinone-9 beta-reductase
MIETEVLIIGAGPAGSACAWQLTRHGIPNLVLDKAAFPRVKPCAGWVTPEVFRLLEVDPEDYPLGLTRFGFFNISLRGLKFKLPTHQYAIRRIEFDNWLLQRSGAEYYQQSVSRIVNDNGRFIIDNQFSSKYLVGAGGTHCPVRRKLFSHRIKEDKTGLIVAKEEEFPYEYDDDTCYLWFFEDGLPGYAWYVPKAEGYLNVGVGGSAAAMKANGTTLNHYWDLLVEKLDTMGLVKNHAYKPLGHSYFLRGPAPQIRDGNAFLVGDSLGLATKDMGEGIGPAIHSGHLAADEIIYNSPYQVSRIPRYSFPSLLRIRP